jgi:hypothetical protein
MGSVSVEGVVLRRGWSLAWAGVVAGVVAAAATVAIAAGARAADVPLTVDGEKIPLLGFAQLTLTGAALGVVVARLLGRRDRFIVVTVAATAVSLVPSLTLPDHLATRVVLVCTHLVAAAIVIPALARLLPIDRSL